MLNNLTIENIIGSKENHIAPDALEAPIATDIICDVKQLKRDAQKQGFDLRIVSGFRSFSRQLVIWNQKCLGQRPVLDIQGQELDIKTLDETALLHAILRWSALPGSSRHHWGTDFDIIDANQLSSGDNVALTVDEAHTKFAAMHQWLDEYLPGSVFFRPYREDRGGVAPEPWHLSHRHVSKLFEQGFDASFLYSYIQQQPLELKTTVLALLPEIIARYVDNINK